MKVLFQNLVLILPLKRLIEWNSWRFLITGRYVLAALKNVDLGTRLHVHLSLEFR